MAQLISDLKALKEAAAQGLITEEEHSRERALIMAGPRSTPTPDGATANMVSAVQALTAVATALTQNATRRVPGLCHAMSIRFAVLLLLLLRPPS